MKSYKYLHTPIRYQILALIFLFFSLTGVAQPGGSEDLGGDPDTSVPVDGGITLLMASAVGYGVARVRKHRTKKLPYHHKSKLH